LGKENFLGNIGGVAITRLTITKLKNVIISYPSKEKQTYFVEKLDNLRNEIEELVKSYSTKLTLLQELKQSLLHKAFQGEL
jgi:type I restriction enzyme S subunit